MILDGPMGAGKTTVTNILRHKLPRTAIIGWDTMKAMVSDFKNGPEDGSMLSKIQKDLILNFMNNNLNIIMDGGFARGERIKQFIQLAQRKEYKLLIYQFTAPQKALVERTQERPKFVWEKKPASKTHMSKRIDFYNEHKYQGEVIPIDSYKLSTKQIANKILKDIEFK